MMLRSFLALAPLACLGWSLAQPNPPSPPDTGFEFTNTSFENASPLSWQIDPDGTVQVFLVYDHERSSPNRANGHWHFQVQARPGSRITLVLNNQDNIYNGQPASPATDRTISFVAVNGREWKPVPTTLLPGNRLRLTVRMPGPSLYVARLEPYRLSDLDHLLKTLQGNPLVEITAIGHTVEGRTLEILRVGNPKAPYRVFLRARAHSWEPGGNWVVEGVIRRLLKNDETARCYLERYCVYILPLANKDGVARGRTRFNSMGKDLNRDWDRAADPELAPENHALESWLEAQIRQGRRPHLAIDFHNDDHGALHLGWPAHTDAKRYRTRMGELEDLLRKHTWFTEGHVGGEFRRAATISEGLLARYGINGVVHELNANWVAGLRDYPSARNWELYGEQLCQVLYEYFASEEP